MLARFRELLYWVVMSKMETATRTVVLKNAYLCGMETLTPESAIHSLTKLLTAEMRRRGIAEREEDVEQAIAKCGKAFTIQIVDAFGEKREYITGYTPEGPFLRQKFDMDAVTRRQLEELLEKYKERSGIEA